MIPTPSPAAVLAAVDAGREDDARIAVRALLMLHPTAAPWRSARTQIERLIAGRIGSPLLAALAEIPARAIRTLVKQRAIALGVQPAGKVRLAWFDSLDAPEQRAVESARASAQTQRLFHDIGAIDSLLGRIADSSRGQRRALFDALAEVMAAAQRGVGGAQLISVSLADPLDDAELQELVDLEVKDLLTGYAFPGDDAGQAGERAAMLPDEEAGAEAQPGDDRPAQAPTAPRRLQVQITEAVSGTTRTKAFRPGAQHAVAVTLSPEALAGALAGPVLNEAAVAFVDPADGGPKTASLTVQFVSEALGQTMTASQPLTLPETGPSTTVTFPLIVDAAGASVKCSVLLFQGAALLQSAVITGPVSARDRAVDGEVMRIVADGEFVAVVGPAPALQTHPVQSSVSTHVGHPGEALVVGDEGRAASVVSLPGAATFRAQITDALRMALDADSLSTTAAGRRAAASAQVRLLRSLAKFGNSLYQELPPDIQALGGQDAIQLICGSDDIVPFEIVYDYGFPKASARLCPTWKSALRTGVCTCAPAVGEVPTICPLGFWGLRLVIERQVADSSAGGATAVTGLPSPGRDTLLPMNRVLFAASQKVDSAPADTTSSAIAATVAVLTERLGKANVSYVKTWPTWRATIERKRPGLILSLPHNDRDSDDLPRLEIGRGKLLAVGALDPSYVLGSAPTPDQVGPAVFLLGCNTANEAVPWYSAASAFRRRGASVVVGTLSEALGRQTAPMTRLLADLLWGAPGVDPIRAETLGDIMLLIRRRLVAEGMTLGMSLVAFGHAGWLLSEAPAANPPGG